jgi:hypothetical protein
VEATGNVHILRHTFCSHLAMRGAAPKAIQNLAGHQHLSTTMRYMHLSPSERERSAYSTGGELTAQWRHMTEPRAHLLRITWHSGGADENRTRDLLHAMQALSQLSYSPDDLRTRAHLYRKNAVLATPARAGSA